MVGPMRIKNSEGSDNRQRHSNRLQNLMENKQSVKFSQSRSVPVKRVSATQHPRLVITGVSSPTDFTAVYTKAVWPSGKLVWSWWNPNPEDVWKIIRQSTTLIPSLKFLNDIKQDDFSTYVEDMVLNLLEKVRSYVREELSKCSFIEVPTESFDLFVTEFTIMQIYEDPVEHQFAEWFWQKRLNCYRSENCHNFNHKMVSNHELSPSSQNELQQLLNSFSGKLSNFEKRYNIPVFLTACWREFIAKTNPV